MKKYLIAITAFFLILAGSFTSATNPRMILRTITEENRLIP
jgi:hypothetical protein